MPRSKQSEGKAHFWNLKKPKVFELPENGLYLARTPLASVEQEICRKKIFAAPAFAARLGGLKNAAQKTHLYLSAPAHKFRQHQATPQSPKKHVAETEARLKKDIAAFAAQLRKHLSSYEFWLGFGCGAATRIATKLAVLTVFSSAATPRPAMVAGFVACAFAGLAAGVIAHLARAFYRNAKLPQGAGKEALWGMSLFESAVIGWLGGVLGGFTTNAGAIAGGSTSFAVGAVAGAVVGIFRALVKEDRSAGKAGMAWERLAFQSAVFGAFGGALGVISSHLFGSGVSVAAPVPVAGADSVIYTNPPAPFHEDFCGTDLCEAPFPSPVPPPMPVVMPVMPMPVVTPQETIIHIVHEYPQPPAPHPVHHVHHAHHAHRAAPPKKTCFPMKPVRHVEHVRHIKHVARHPERIEYKPPSFEVIYAAPPPPQPLPPPQMIMPQPAVPAQPVNPCDTGDCAPHCINGSQLDINRLDIKGPCGDPNTPCAERISFNENGEATKVVLEPQAVKTFSSYFEIRHASDAPRVADLNGEGKNALAPKAGSDAKVSLILPLSDNRTLALADAASGHAA